MSITNNTELETIEPNVKKMTLKAIRAEATELTHQYNWNGLRLTARARLDALKEEFESRTNQVFHVQKIYYP
ncbi:MAG: hypothetical protein LUM44_17840 [Pyrinomonadaceae bacterium]|nr:hypothetical protein [Pyrinomonadaceae bacterium]